MSLLELLCALSILGVLCFAGMHFGRLHTERSALYVSKAQIEHALSYARNLTTIRHERLRLTVEVEGQICGLTLHTIPNGRPLRHWSWSVQGLRLSWSGLGKNQNGPEFYPEPYVWNSNGQFHLCNSAGRCGVLLVSKLGRVRLLMPAKQDDV